MFIKEWFVIMVIRHLVMLKSSSMGQFNSITKVSLVLRYSPLIMPPTTLQENRLK